jgi:pimeloyl-ACP methyl ester carboxylesterase
MQALFVHGMGRSPLSALPLLWRLKKHGIAAHSIFYSVTFEKFDSIVGRLRNKILQIANAGDYVLVGHSLGGMLIRSAVASLPTGTRLPSRIFLLGSPVRPSRVAQFFQRFWIYRLVTRDCGQLLSSEERMRQIAPSFVPTTSIVGTRGFHGWLSPFGNEPNDCIVSASEVAADWISEEVQVSVTHTYMPSNRRVSEVVIQRLINGSS